LKTINGCLVAALVTVALARASADAATRHADLASQRQDLASHSVEPWGVDLVKQDRSVRPGDNFYEYQNGKWLSEVQFGPNEKAQAYWRDLRLLSPRRLVAIFEGLALERAASSESVESKASAIYRSYMDEKAAETKGLSPLKPELDELRAVSTKSQMAALMGKLAGPGTIRAQSVYGRPTGWSFFRLDNIDQDRINLGRCAIYLAAGGMTLPGPEYYTETQFANLRTAYVAYIAKVLTLIGWPNPRDIAIRILDLETQLAKVSWSHEAMLDPLATYNPTTVGDLAEVAPGFDWSTFMRGAGLADAQDVVIDAKSAFPKIADIFGKASLDVLKARHAFAIVDQHSDLLNAEILAAAIEFRGNALGDGIYFGAAPRNLRAEKEAEATIPDIVSALYVNKYSSPEVKIAVQEMAENMRRALDVRLKSVPWMSQASQAKAREKLAKMRFAIGYPDHFDNYAGLDIKDNDVYANHRRSAEYQWRNLVRRLDKPFDYSIWSIKPEYATFNYLPTSNTVEIPAALLVPPFFDINADQAVNYGSAGTILGAMIAGPFFTKQGLSYDTSGQLKPWLAEEEIAKFSALSNRIAGQYSTVQPLPGLHLKGDLLADEALGDLAGLQVSLDAYHSAVKGTKGRLLDGYNGDQRFFLGRAHMWRAKFVESFVRSQIATGSNEPPFMRVNGLLPNMDAWYQAFEIKPGDRLYIAPEKRVSIW